LLGQSLPVFVSFPADIVQDSEEAELVAAAAAGNVTAAQVSLEDSPTSETAVQPAS